MRYHFETIEIPDNRNAVKNGIIQWGSNNDYPLFLAYLFQNSPTHCGIVNGKINKILSGLVVDESNGVMRLNKREIIESIVRDYEIYNGFAIKVIKKGTERYYDYIPFANIRATEDGKWLVKNIADKKDKGVIYDDYYLSPFSEVSLAVFFIPPLPSLNSIGERYNNYYPMPSYNGGIPSIITEIEINQFHLTEATSGFKGGLLVALNNGIPRNQEDRRAIERSIEDAVKSRNKTSGVLIIYSDGKERAPEITSLNGNNLDTRYLNLKDTIIEQILISHQITSPLLVGIKTPGQLGNTQELAIAWEIFKSEYIEPRRTQIKKWLNEIGIRIIFNDVTPAFIEKYSSVRVKEKEEHDEVLQLLMQYGKERKDVNEIISSEDIHISLLHKYQENGGEGISDVQRLIIKMLDDGDDFNAIMKAAKINADDLLKEVSHLIKIGYLNKRYEPTSKGLRELKRSGYVIRTYYEYRVRPEMGEPIIATTREFCKKLINSKRIYLRSEIDEISRRVGRDVWLYRGGFYHDPIADKTYPACRHTWFQMLVREEI